MRYNGYNFDLVGINTYSHMKSTLLQEENHTINTTTGSETSGTVHTTESGIGTGTGGESKTTDLEPGREEMEWANSNSNPNHNETK
jgi:hypothetical protein